MEVKVKQILVIMSIILILLAGCSKSADELVIGSWVADYNRTMKSIMDSEIWAEMSETEQVLFPDILEEMLQNVVIEIDKEKLRMIVRDIENDYPCTITDVDKDNVTLQCESEGNVIELVVNIIDKNHMSFKSSATNDMDYYIWKRSGKIEQKK